jgi:MATE family multidrug resistance protein
MAETLAAAPQPAEISAAPNPTSLDESSASPLMELLSIALPTVAQMASYTIMQFIDTWMLSRIGPLAATSASNSGILSFAFVGFGMGVLIIVNTLVSQSFGRGDRLLCGRYLWQGVWFGLILGLAMLPLIAVARPVFLMFGHAPEQAAMEATYSRIVLISAAIKLVSTAVGQFFLGINKPNAVLMSAVVGVSVNALAAYAIVLGHFGFAPHGVAGAAWAQNIGVTVELAMLLGMLAGPAVFRGFGVFDLVPRSKDLFLLIRIGVPSGLQWLSEILAWSIFCNGVIGIVGQAAMEANTFMLRFMVVSFMPAFGLSTAVTALVGRYIGRGRPDIAVKRANLAFGVTLIYIMLCGSVFILGRHMLIGFFTRDPAVIRIGATYLVIAAIYELFDAMYIIYSGGLRGAGDTTVPAIFIAGLCWTVMVGGGYIVARWVPALGPAGPWIMACLYGIILGLFMVARFRGGSWKKIRLGGEAGKETLLGRA